MMSPPAPWIVTVSASMPSYMLVWYIAPLLSDLSRLSRGNQHIRHRQQLRIAMEAMRHSRRHEDHAARCDGVVAIVQAQEAGASHNRIDLVLLVGALSVDAAGLDPQHADHEPRPLHDSLKLLLAS